MDKKIGTLVLSILLGTGWLCAMQTSENNNTSKALTIVGNACKILGKGAGKGMLTVVKYPSYTALGGAGAVACAYCLVPPARQPIRSAGCWVGSKLYKAYARICYEMQVRPLQEEAERLELEKQNAIADNKRLKKQAGEAALRVNQLTRESNELNASIEGLFVKTEEVERAATDTGLAVASLGRLRENSSESFGCLLQCLRDVGSVQKSWGEKWQETHTILTTPVSVSFEQSSPLLVPSVATGQALQKRNEESQQSIDLLKQSSQLTQEQLAIIEKQLPQLLVVLGLSQQEQK